ncbi:MAG: hypothetical protein AVDCRST_MAG87-2401, partial [uncultured Thermomicrobiales bacterium]
VPDQRRAGRIRTLPAAFNDGCLGEARAKTADTCFALASDPQGRGDIGRQSHGQSTLSPIVDGNGASSWSSPGSV